MTKSIHLIGLEAGELPTVTSVVSLLRHPDPNVVDLCRQAVLYLRDIADAPKPIYPHDAPARTRERPRSSLLPEALGAGASHIEGPH